MQARKQLLYLNLGTVMLCSYATIFVYREAASRVLSSWCSFEN